MKRNYFSNYRPISILPQFSKILEKLLFNRLNDFVEKCNIISDSQYGFRQERSTSTGLIELIEEITATLDSKKSTKGVLPRVTCKKTLNFIE